MNIIFIIIAIAILVFNIFVVCKFIQQKLKTRNFIIKVLVFIIGLNFMAACENYITNTILKFFN